MSKRLVHGPGGLHCVCCGTPPGAARRKVQRAIRRSNNQAWKAAAARELAR